MTRKLQINAGLYATYLLLVFAVTYGIVALALIAIALYTAIRELDPNAAGVTLFYAFCMFLTTLPFKAVRRFRDMRHSQFVDPEMRRQNLRAGYLMILPTLFWLFMSAILLSEMIAPHWSGIQLLIYLTLIAAPALLSAVSAFCLLSPVSEDDQAKSRNLNADQQEV